MKNFLILSSIIALLAITASGCQNQQANVEGSKESAEAWVKNTLPGYTLTGFSTATLDSDGDGYVQADITVQKNGSTELRLITLYCPTQGGALAIQKGSGAKFGSMPFESRF